jgi:dolichol-phosphate mannosyltransferase
LSICIGIPVKNESQNIPLLQKQLSSLIDKAKYNGITFCICINDNLSTDGSIKKLLAWQDSDNRVKVYRLHQPLDFQSSIQNLMKKTSANAFAILQSDLQDPIADFEKLLDTYVINQEHIVAGRAVTRKGSRFVNRVRSIFYWLLSSSSGTNYVSGFQDFYILPKYVYSQTASLPSNRLFIRGYLYFNFTKIIFIDYQRVDRIFGESKFNFAKMYDLALDGLLLYGRRFIRILSFTSFLIFISSLIFGLVILIMSFLGFDFGSKGWTSIILSISILVSILGMLSGVILEYLIRIYSSLNLSHKD